MKTGMFSKRPTFRTPSPAVPLVPEGGPAENKGSQRRPLLRGAPIGRSCVGFLPAQRRGGGAKDVNVTMFFLLTDANIAGRQPRGTS